MQWVGIGTTCWARVMSGSRFFFTRRPEKVVWSHLFELVVFFVSRWNSQPFFLLLGGCRNAPAMICVPCVCSQFLPPVALSAFYVGYTLL